MYRLKDGRVVNADELRVLYSSIFPFYKEVEFRLWLDCEIERKVIKVVKN